MTQDSTRWRRIILGSGGFGIALAAALALVFIALPLPSITLLALDYQPTWGWLPALLPVTVLVGLAAALLVRQWRWKRLVHDLLAAFLLPGLVAALASFMLMQSARTHEQLLDRASPRLSVQSIERLEKGYIERRLSAEQFVEACRYYRRWLYLETGEAYDCRFPDSSPLEFPPQASLATFGARHAAVDAALDEQATAMRVAAVLPWLAMLLGLLAGFVTRRPERAAA